MEAALQEESEERYRVLMENAGEAIFVTEEGMLKSVNIKTEELIGYAKEDLISRPFIDFVHPNDRTAVLDRYFKSQQDKDVPSRYSFRVVHRSGETLWVELNVVFIEWDGKPATLNFLSDITDLKHKEEERQNLEERLQRAEKMEALGTLAGGVAHDLNNVLGIVVGYAEMLLMDTDKSSPMREELENIMSGGQRAAAIVQDLLTLARRGVSRRTVLNLNRIITNTQQSPEFKNLSSYHPSIKIRTDLEPGLLNISGSSVHLGKTVFNLVSNASEAMPNGGIVTIKTSNQYLDKPIQGYDDVREGDYVVLSVSDTGEGIAASDLQRIFEPFYTKKVMGRSGTGLGLAVVWGTVKDHSGYVNVESEEGKGSTFTLHFPVTREDIPAEAAAISISEYMGKGESILIVDDVKGQRDLATGMLRKLNYNVASVSSGEEAIAYLKEHHADLIVLDMIMDPGMDGLDTYKSILEIHPKQKAIIVSGFSESDRVHAAQDLGAGAYVRKPYVIEKLGLAAKKELDRK
jgi:PAS domain S-box-containing protein